MNEIVSLIPPAVARELGELAQVVADDCQRTSAEAVSP